MTLLELHAHQHSGNLHYSSTCCVLGGPAKEWLLVSPPVHPDNFSWSPSLSLFLYRQLRSLASSQEGKRSIISESKVSWTVVDAIAEHRAGRVYMWEKGQNFKLHDQSSLWGHVSGERRFEGGGNASEPRMKVCPRQRSSTGSSEPIRPTQG